MAFFTRQAVETHSGNTCDRISSVRNHGACLQGSRPEAARSGSKPDHPGIHLCCKSSDDGLNRFDMLDADQFLIESAEEIAEPVGIEPHLLEYCCVHVLDVQSILNSC